MATKRSAPQVHPSRQEQVPGEPRRKRQKPDNAGPKSFKKAHPVNELKSQIRSLKRLLERNDTLPATIRAEKERALQTAQHDLREAERAKKRSDMIGKYHKVRFFDRQKAAKRLKRAQKELKACGGDEVERTRLARVVEDAEVDANYPQYYPLDQPYVRLFAQTDGDDDVVDDDKNGGDGELKRTADDAMWHRVKQCMADGTLKDLRNGRLTGEKPEDEAEDVDASAIKKTGRVPQKARSGKLKGGPKSTNQGEGIPNQDEQDEDESDGGFFE